MLSKEVGDFPLWSVVCGLLPVLRDQNALTKHIDPAQSEHLKQSGNRINATGFEKVGLLVHKERLISFIQFAGIIADDISNLSAAQ